METLRIATRNSPLALWQAQYVAEILKNANIQTELLPLETLGDRKLEVSLSKIGDKGVFTQELEQKLLSGEAHLAVHSAKDLPSRLPPGLEIIAFTERENPADVLVSHRGEIDLFQKLRIGTSSTRRVATLKRNYPHIETVTVRGNLQTRFRKMEEGQCDALLLAYAGVHRMGFSSLIREFLPLEVFTPAVGQGSLAIEVAQNLPTETKTTLQNLLMHWPTGHCLMAERSFLQTMEGGCSVPVFGHAYLQTNQLHLTGGIISLDGKEEIRHQESMNGNIDPESAADIGKLVAEKILNLGGDEILRKIKQNLQP